MTWQLRHEGSPQAVSGLTLPEIIEGLRDGRWQLTDEVKGPADPQWVPIENHPQLAEVAAELEQAPLVHVEETHLDMNALIDVTLVLLIFFILTTAHAAAIQKVVRLPKVSVDAKTGVRRVSSAQVKRYMVQVKVRGQGAGKHPLLQVQGKPANVWREEDDPSSLDEDKLVSLLRPYAKTEMVLDAERISWGLVIQIQDAARAAGITQVHHLSRQGEKK
jgi:biopolymer transport protein ExbD